MASSLGDGPTSTQPAPQLARVPDKPVPEIPTQLLPSVSSGKTPQNASIADKIVTPNLERLLTKCSQNELNESGSSSSFLEKCQDILAAWNIILKEKVIQMCQTTTPQNQPPEYKDINTYIKKLLRLHQKHVIDELWTESPGHLKTGLFNVLTQAEPLFGLPTNPDPTQTATPSLVADKKPIVGNELAKELSYLKSIHANAWNGLILKPILTANTDFKSAEYFQMEAPDLCLKRLAVLVGTKLYLPAFNLASYCVKKSGLEPGGAVPSGNRIIPNWLLSPDTKTELLEILDVYIGLLFKIKRDTLLYLPMLKNWPVADVLDMIARFQQRAASISDSGHGGVFNKYLRNKPEGKKVSGATAAANAAIDFLMVLAAKRPLAEPELAKIVSLWTEKCSSLNEGTEENFIANLEIEVEKYSSLEGLSNHLYEIGVQMYRKYGKNSQQLALDTMLRGFHFDLNRREVAIHKQDVVVLKAVEENLALGMQKLALVFEKHVAARRECILTAFSLTPTQDLMQEVEALARESGFVEDQSTVSGGGEDNKAMPQTEAWSRVDNFEAACKDFTSSLEAKKYSRAYCGPIKERQVRNLDALLAIEGNLITEAANYDPVAAPFPSFSSLAMGGHLSERTLGDVLTCISCPRWHHLSWVLDWPALQDRCSALLKDPEMRIPGGIKRELKYLVIDYTQFEEWSSDEEVMAQSGIEKGYEAWEDEDYVDPTHVDEHGLGDDEEFDFNVIPKLIDDECGNAADNDDDLYIYPEDYLPSHAKTHKSKQKSKAAAAKGTKR